MNPPTPQVKAAMEGGLGHPVDPEERRLFDLMSQSAYEMNWMDNASRERFEDARQALRDHRTKPSAPSNHAAALDDVSPMHAPSFGASEQHDVTAQMLRADLIKNCEAVSTCEGCGAPLFADDDFVAGEDASGCWSAMTDTPSKRERPCYAYRVGKCSANHRTKAAPQVVVELLPCPFCAADDTIIYGIDSRFKPAGTHCVRCKECEACAYGKGSQGAIAAWNTRHSPALPDKRVEPTDEGRPLRDTAGFEIPITRDQAFEIWCSMPDTDTDYRAHAFAQYIIRHFSPISATPTVDTRIPVTDEAMQDFLVRHNWRDAGPCIEHTIRAALVHFSNPITGGGEV